MLKISKNIMMIIFIFLVFFIAGVQAQSSGYLSVNVENGMQVYIDTTFVAENSFSFMELPVGNYSVHVYKTQSHDWADRGMTKYITINEDEYVKLDFVLSDQIKVLSLPVGGNVFAGNELIGSTPLTFDRSLVGNQTIKIEKNGYENQSFELDNGQREYSFSLQPIENNSQHQIARVSESSGGLKWYREGLVVTSLIASWTSFYYKRQADQSYARYQVTSDSRKRFAYWNQTRQYDVYAEVAIGVAAATLGTYFFLLLID